ncbi:ketoacyl-synthetase C-terminal extension domain-containing protein, partial [Lysobacter sp. 2RAB21]
MLALKHRQLPPAASFERLNPHIDLSDSPFVVNTALKTWPENAKGGRSAVISSFGFSGTNAHLVLEAAPTRDTSRAAEHEAASARAALIPLSAKTPEQLRQRAQSLADALADGLAARTDGDDAQAAPSLHDIAYTLQVGREAMEERCALVAHSLAELEARLRAFAAERTPADMHVGSSLSRAGKLAFIGQDAELKAVLIDTCLREGKLDKLAELWVDGVDLPWAKLYPAQAGHGPRRVELPLYPFAREHYWLEDDTAAVAQRAEGAVATIHPLLHVNASTLRQQRYRSTFDGSESFLRDHRVRLREGRVEHVLPGVAYLEMAAAAIADALPDAFADTASGRAALSSGSHGRLTLRDVVW